MQRPHNWFKYNDLKFTQMQRPQIYVNTKTPNFTQVLVGAEAGARVNISVSQTDISSLDILEDEDDGDSLKKSPSLSSDVLAEVVVEAGVIACHVCSSVAHRSNKPDDTDSFTPRVRSDKRSITILLGKGLSTGPDIIKFFKGSIATIRRNKALQLAKSSQMTSNKSRYAETCTPIG